MNPIQQYRQFSRREFLTTAAGGVGGVALASLLATQSVARDIVNPLAPRKPHFAPRAKNCIFIFISGGTSQVDLFDIKPKLNEMAGKPLAGSHLQVVRFVIFS